MTTKKKETKPFNFEKSIEHLNTIIEKMEHGDLPLEDSLKYFEQGIQLIRQCQNALKKAEQKVEILTQQQGKEKLKPYQSNE